MIEREIYFFPHAPIKAKTCKKIMMSRGGGDEERKSEEKCCQGRIGTNNIIITLTKNFDAIEYNS